MKPILRTIAAVIVLLTLNFKLGTFNCSANNLRISNIVYAAAPAPASISFDIAWDNSWFASSYTVTAGSFVSGRKYSIASVGTTDFTLIGASSNTVGTYFTATGAGAGTGVANAVIYDAIWIFIKNQSCAYQPSATTPIPPWNHVALNATSSTHTVGSILPNNLPVTIDAVSDGMGVFIHQISSNLSSAVTARVTLQLTAAAVTYNWKVMGIEMAYIPENAFSVGDGSGAATNFNNAGAAVNIASDAAIGGGALYAGSPAVPAPYPVGFNAFYCMKHEISQTQYTDFLNTLSYDQQVNRTTQAPNSGLFYLNALTLPGPGTIYNRNGIKMNSITGQNGLYNFTPASYGCDLGNNNVLDETNDGLYVACNYLSWMDICAYLDWAALRPMSEMEYEKVCRGYLAPVANEYPWGSTLLTPALSSAITTGGQVSEYSNARIANGLCVYNNAGTAGTDGPLRVGASTWSTTNRVQAGAAYYGVLDMAGNVWEQAVSVDATGVNFTGSLGNGVLTTGTTGYAGNATNADWPGIDATPANGVTGGTGSGARGGSWHSTTANLLYTSDRTNAATPVITRDMEYGGRGVR